MKEECAAALVVQQEIQIFLTLEGVVQLEDERMVERHENLPLEFDVVEVVLLLQDRLVEHLHRVVGAPALLFFFLDEEDFSKASLTKKADHANRPKVDLTAEVLQGVWTASLHDVTLKRYALVL